MTNAEHFEGKLHAFRRTQDGTVVSFVVHPQEAISTSLATVALGTRFMVAVAEIGEDEKAKDASAVPVDTVGDQLSPKREASPPHPRRKFSDLSLPQQAGMRCGEPLFAQWVTRWNTHLVCEEGDPAAYVRRVCGIKSRSELSTNHDAANKWRKLNSDYEAWLTTQQYAESIR